MKIAIVNGSPRKGNTVATINAFVEGAKEKHEINVIHADQLSISGCKGCNACQCYKGCVANDDTNPTIDQLVDADMIVFGTPVYWWGMTAQLKCVIDKCYCKGALLKDKKIGVIVVGGAATDNIQYELIKKQFECMAQYLSWNIEFYRSFSANAKDELAKNQNALDNMRTLGKALR